MNNFWKKTRKRPFFCLAPMADVTDSAFRKIIAKYGKPDIFWTEFVSADGLSHPTGRKKLLLNLKFSRKEHPIVAQIFGSNSENIKKAVSLCAKLGFDGVDINMGCPDRSIEKQGAGAKMIGNYELAEKIIHSAKEGSKLPVSVKTRLGYGKVDISWIGFLLKQNLPALTVHLRTRKEMSKVPAHWELAKDLVKLRDKINKNTLLILNGDVQDIADGIKKTKESGCDGIMIGRGIFGKPWLFKNTDTYNFLSPRVPRRPLSARRRAQGRKIISIGISDKLKILLEHTKLFEKELGKHKNFAVMKKHFKAYINGFDGAKELRTKLMKTKNAREVEKIIKEFLKNN